MDEFPSCSISVLIFSFFFYFFLFFVSCLEIKNFLKSISWSYVINFFSFRFLFSLANFFLFTFETLASKYLFTGFVLNFRFEYDRHFILYAKCTNKHFYRSHESPSRLRLYLYFNCYTMSQPQIFRTFSYVERRNKSFESGRVDPNAGALQTINIMIGVLTNDIGLETLKFCWYRVNRETSYNYVMN